VLPSKPKPKKAKKKNAIGKSANTKAKLYAELLSNPCAGPLVTSVGGSSGSGVVSRVRNIYTNSAVSGYVIWFPSYHGTSTTGSVLNPYNLFVYEGDPTLNPTNTVANPMGMGAANSVRGSFLVDPASSLLAANTSFSRAKTIAACITTEYSGAVSTAAGTIARVSTISMAAYMPVSAGLSVPLSTNQIYAYAANRGRILMEGEEVRWRPTDTSSVMRDIAFDGAGAVYHDNAPDTCWWSGNTGVSGTYITGTDLDESGAIALAWTGVPIGTLNLQFTKVLELELSVRQNMLEEINVPRTTTIPGGVKKITEVLDNVAPGWQTAATEVAGSAARYLAKAAVNAFTMPTQMMLKDW